VQWLIDKAKEYFNKIYEWITTKVRAIEDAIKDSISHFDEDFKQGFIEVGKYIVTLVQQFGDLVLEVAG
jgi:hypothetical protein